MRDIAAFLQSTIMGKTLYTAPLVYSLENGRLEGDYRDQMSFTNLLLSSTGMRFDLLVVSRERIFHMENGQRAELRKDFSGASHFRYELAKRKSTGRITGSMRYIAASFDDVPAEGMTSAVLNMRLEDGEVRWSEKESIYRDQPSADGGYKPVAFEAECRMFVENGRAAYAYNGRCLDVDPDTLARTPSDSVLPAFVAREKGTQSAG
ncbi:MAG: hypothetical protein LUC93_04315 [Planctomycetaceae bacterium]|nr:hypothetical protein [Planctomycetaceae bacterium]